MSSNFSLSTIATPSSSRRAGRPPRTETPLSRKRRAAAAANAAASTPGGHDSVGDSSAGGNSVLSSQVRPTHSFTGGMNLFGGFDDDLDNFAKYVHEEDDDEDDDEEQGEELSARQVTFESDEESGNDKQGGMFGRLRRSFDMRRKKRSNKAKSQPLQHQMHNYQQQPHSSRNLVLGNEDPLPPKFISQTNPEPSNIILTRPQSTLSKCRDPPSLIIPSGLPPRINRVTPPSNGRSQSVPDYRTYNQPKSTLPKIGSFDLDIDTIPASPRIEEEYVDVERNMEEDKLVPSSPSWNSSSTCTTTALIPYASGGVELMDSTTSESLSRGHNIVPLSLHRQASWDRRLERTDIYDRHYIPSRQELAELKELEDYLGVLSPKIKHRFSTLWRHLVPNLETARLGLQRQNTMHSHHSTSSVSDLSSVTNHVPGAGGKSKPAPYSIVLKRGAIQFEEYQDFQCELILLTHGFVVARPNFQFIPRFQAGDLWTSVVQVQPTNPLSITLSCSSQAASSHLTLTQLKQQQQYGCYTYEISCATPQEQASWLEALRKVVVQAHDSAGTREKEMGGLGWQYRVVYVPFFTEAVTGDPIQRDKILAGSTGHVDLNALDSYNSYAPLHYATRANHIRVMAFLLEAGADVHVGDGYGRTPMYYAELHQLPEASIELLEANGAQRSKKLISAAVAKGVWRERNWRRIIFIILMVFLLLCCATGALLWKFGLLEPFGIGGNAATALTSSEGSPTSEPGGSPEPTPLPSPVPPLVSRDIATPEPSSPPVYIKTLPPTAEVAGPRQDPPTWAPLPDQAPPPLVPGQDDDALLDLLSSASFDAGSALRIPGSPQDLAFQWLRGNANLASYTNGKKIQRYALATLYYSLNGDSWGDKLWWLTDEDECMWFNKQTATGFPACEIGTSSNAQKILTSLDLSFNNLQGTIPPEIGLLSGLRRLDLDGGPSGFLIGSLPPTLGYLNSMESFSCRGNQLTGTVPADLGSWRNIRGLDLSFNKLSGPLPASFASMMWLTELNLEMNQMTGVLPAVELGRLSNLFKLALGGNKFVGPIPTEIGLLTKLRYLYLEANNFSSSLPTQLGLLANLNLLSAFENKFTGVLPSEIGGLEKVGSILLRSNAFSSTIPSEMGLLRQLQSTLDLSYNQFSGPIPSEIGNLNLLRSLYLQSNKLNGYLPNEVSQLNALRTLRIEANDFVGVVPTSLCDVFSETQPNFYADCKAEVTCNCCTYCCSDVGDTGGGCTCQYAGTEQAYLC